MCKKRMRKGLKVSKTALNVRLKTAGFFNHKQRPVLGFAVYASNILAENPDANDGLIVGVRLLVRFWLFVSAAVAVPPPMRFCFRLGVKPEVFTVSMGMRLSPGKAVSGFLAVPTLLLKVTSGS